MKIYSMRTDHLVFGIYSTVLLCLVFTRGSVGETSSNSSCSVTQYTCTNLKCIPVSWTCDSDDDCGDNTDETLPDCQTTCAENEFKCIANGKCIPQRWTCDGESDCGDGSDENHDLCSNRHCNVDQFKCKSGLCIPKSWQCDGSSDCDATLAEDEQNCKAECTKDEFKCNNTQCIALQWKCDFEKDCKDGSDETQCGPVPTSCDAGEFQCHDGPCIRHDWVCDGDLDCTDNSDEKNCSLITNRTCSINQFQCKSSGECIHMSWFCDNDPDCEDESDEDCIKTCRPDQFMCQVSHDCLSETIRCDGNVDCQDGSDELNCSNQNTSACTDDQFDCGDVKAGELKCIQRNLVCDGTPNCPNFNDESPELGCAHNTCNKNNGGCSQKCVNLFRNKHRCECDSGYKLMANSLTVCDDIDECHDNHIHGACSQRCINTKGSFKCECMDGYQLENNRYCKAKSGRAELLLADRKDLRRISLEAFFEYKLLLNESKISGAIAMDYDYSAKKIYWTDVTKEKIFSSDLDDTSNVVEVVKDNLNTPDGLAVDWINKYVYWTDTGYDRIEVASLDGKFRKTLIHTDLDEPRAIVLDPNNGYMYWTDWGKNPKIERSGLDGNNREVIVSENITWPNGITIDYSSNRLYWIDAKLHTIESANLDGTDRAIILRSHSNLKHPFAITVFEDYLYWTDWPSKSVRKYSKFGRENVEEIVLNLHSPMDVHVFHPYRQQTTRRFCRENNGGCHHLCLPKALLKAETYDPTQDHYTCACDNGFELATDMKTCHLIEMTSDASVVVKTTPLPSQPDSPNRSHNRSVIPVVTTAHPPIVSHIEVTTENSGYTIANQMNQTRNAPEHFSDENIGQIAGIVVGILLAVILIIGVVVFVLYKRYSRGNGKSMNFDNPVYRKTTTDELIIEKNRSELPPSMQPLTTTVEVV